ncbi:hypothetical protein KAK03_17205 [Ideonella sp. 3Y2]|uniref:Lipoprotein n=2 Tax=Ideonella alba TaxID=2824118 RepID=A0A941BFM2_9BURK|nr:hypothetical protein [Ideonella alba]
MMLRLVPPLMACALLAGCSKPPGTELFPLDDGHRWTYQVRSEYENNTTETETRVLRSLGRDSLADGSAWHRRSDDGIDYWLRSDDTGIFRVATKSDLDDEPKKDALPRYVLKAPLAVGTGWQATTTAYLLRRRQEFPPEIRHSHPSIPMNYTIEALGEAVKTAAGDFSGCLRVRGIATLRLFADPVVGWKDMPLTTREWYCPGVGLVKLVREEPANSTFLTGGTLTMELTEWQ